MLITRSQLAKIIKEEIDKELSEATAQAWNQEVMSLLKRLDPLYPQVANQQERVEEIILSAFNEIEANPEISAVLLSKAIKGFSRQKANRTLATNLIIGALERLSPEAGKMFKDKIKSPKASAPQRFHRSAPQSDPDDDRAVRSQEVTRAAKPGEVTQPGYRASWKKDGNKITYY